ncbi:MAG: hypothetical protein Kow0059_09610 [Candidatus Sumerlaeia bacterium]
MLLLTLWIAVVLSLLVYSLTYQVQMELKLTSMSKKQFQARALAQAAIARGIADIKNDYAIEQSDPKMRFDGEGDIWARPEEGKVGVSLGRGFYTCRIEDAESRFNINRVGREIIQAMIEYLGYEKEYAEKVSAAILDWADPDDRPYRGEAESERELYARYLAEWRGEPSPEDAEPIRIKNDKYLTVEELLSVPGVTPEMFYGIPPEGADKDPWRRYDPKHPPDQIVGLRDMLSVDSTGSININTAGPHVLAVAIIAGGGDMASAYENAQKIIAYRRDGRTEDINNDKAFRTVNDLNNVTDIGPAAGQLRKYLPITVNSQLFGIMGEGQVGDVRKTIQVLVRRDWQTYRRDETKEGEQWREKSERLRVTDETEMTAAMPEVRIHRWREF